MMYIPSFWVGFVLGVIVGIACMVIALCILMHEYREDNKNGQLRK